MGANLIFLKYLKCLVHKISNKFFIHVNSSKDQVISLQLWEQDRFHLKSRKQEGREYQNIKSPTMCSTSRNGSSTVEIQSLFLAWIIFLLIPCSFKFLVFRESCWPFQRIFLIPFPIESPLFEVFCLALATPAIK